MKEMFPLMQLQLLLDLRFIFFSIFEYETSSQELQLNQNSRLYQWNVSISASCEFSAWPVRAVGSQFCWETSDGSSRPMVRKIPFLTLITTVRWREKTVAVFSTQPRNPSASIVQAGNYWIPGRKTADLFPDGVFFLSFDSSLYSLFILTLFNCCNKGSSFELRLFTIQQI